MTLTYRLLILLAPVALVSAPQLVLARPEIPAILRDVHLTDANQYTYPVVPPFRTSADGRVAVDMKPRSPELYLLSPEKLSKPLTAPGTSAGVPIVADQRTLNKTDFYDANFYDSNGYTDVDPEHRTICDGTFQVGSGGTTIRNPHPCDPANPQYADPAGTTADQDCYTLTMITSVQFKENEVKKVQLWGTPFTVVVDDPKRWGVRGNATISQVVKTPPSVMGRVFYSASLLEPMVTNDGRLLVGRLGHSPRDPNTDDTTRPSNGEAIDKLDTVYATYPEHLAPCDVTQWTMLHPLSHAYHDPAMRGRYGIAAYPFRDAHNREIANGDDLQVSYPWIDRHGNNLFFTTLYATLYNDDGAGNVTSRYQAQCYDPGRCVLPASPAEIGTFEYLENFRGVGFAGLWSYGKMVLLDSVLNNIDYGLGRENHEQVLLDLYTPGTNPTPSGDQSQSGTVRAGTGRDNGPPAPAMTTENSAFIDSLEQLFNYNDNLTPLTVRDVVWTINTGKVSAELAFDDYLDPNALIIAEMSGALQHTGRGGVYLHYGDGFTQTAVGHGGTAPVVTGPEVVQFQNAATATAWTLPPFGRGHGDVRLEPVALGGIEGKGAWLDGTDDAIAFDLAAQPQKVGKRAWYLGLFVDARFDDATRRQLVVFPDGSELVLVGRHTVEYEDATGTVRQAIPLTGVELKHGGWTHLGLVLDFPGNRTTLYVDGLAFKQTTGVPFQLIEGSLYLGDAPNDPTPGFVGWLDDFKLLAYEPNAEVKCNHARGTLMGLTASAGEPWRSLAAHYPPRTHTTITNALAANGYPTYATYVCYHDYAAPLRASLRLVTDPALASVRDHLLFPEGPLQFNVGRPDSSANAFCLSCHHGKGRHGLGLSALAASAPGVDVQNDARRQPMMPPRLILGNVPEDLFGSGPADDLYTSDHGIDQYVFP